MQKGKCWGRMLLGVALAAWTILLPMLLLPSLGALVRPFGAAMGLRRAQVKELGAVLDQLRYAGIQPPLGLTALALCVGGISCRRARGGRMHRVTSGLCWALAFIACAALSLWFAEVNGIQLGQMVKALAPVIASGAL